MSKSPLRNTILTLLFLLGGVQSSFATHIIGGEMNYKCLGNNEYEVSLLVYRDCFLGEAPFDDTAYVAVFDIQGELIETLPILLGTIDSIQQKDACLLIPPNICVESTTYIDTISLLPRVGGYHLAYQRCCRNSTILNVIDPLNTGATYDIVLTEAAMLNCNNSPVLKEEPPTFVCVNRPLSLDNSAIDEERDSLVYRLCTPFDGGISIDNPRPRPAFPPPYEEIRWNSPTYNLNNLLGGQALTIDAKTGLLTGMPNTIGQFVVGICIDEYRNGQFLSTTRRDFQYNVIPCMDVIAQFDLPTEQCEDLTIFPINQTEGEPDGFLWQFLDRKSKVIGTSTQKSPSYTFPDTGQYTVRLIINPNSVCADSTSQSIHFRANTLTPDLQYDILSCADSLVLQFTDKSSSTSGAINSWLWTFDGEIDQLTSRVQNPTIILLNSQKLRVHLQVGTESGCLSETEVELNAMIIPDSFSVSVFDTLILCKGDSIPLNPIFNPNLTYSWSPTNGLNDPTAPNPLAFPDSSVAYVVMIRDSGDNCELRKNVFIEVIDFDNSFDYSIDTLACGDSVRLQLIPDPDYDLSRVDLVWEIENNGNRQFFTNESPVFIINNEEIIKISGTVSDDFGCRKTIINTLQFEFVQDEISTQLSVCRGDSIALNPNYNTNHQYLWSPSSLFENPTTPNPIIAPRTNQVINVSISAPTASCPIQRTIDLTVLNSFETADFSYSINGCTDSLILSIIEIIVATPENIAEVYWQLNGTKDTLFSSDLQPTFVLKNSQTAELVLTINGNSACPKTISKTIQLNILKDLNLPKRLDICRGESIALNPSAAYLEYMYTWSPSNLIDNPNAVNPVVRPNESTIFQVSYTDSTQLCTLAQTINLKVRDTLPPLEATFEVACDARAIQIKPNNLANISYNFGDGNQLIDASNLVTHTYEFEGIYEVNLKYADENICADSASFELDLPINNLVPDFDWNVESCTDNIAALELLDLSKTAYGVITDWNWSLSTGVSSTEQEPLFPINSNVEMSATLVITLDNNPQCQDSLQIIIPPLLITEEVSDTFINCLGNTISLNPTFNENYQYAWSPKEGLNDANAPNPSVVIQEAQQYFVLISNEFECAIMDSIFVIPAPAIEIDILEIPVICDTMEVVLLAESGQTDQLIWQNEIGDTLGSEPELLVTIDHAQTYTVTFIDAYNCQEAANVFVDFRPVLLEYAREQPACEGATKQLILNNLVPNSTLKVDWIPTTDILEGAKTLQPTVQIEEPTTFSFTVGNEAGCNATGEIFVDLLPLPEIAATAEPTTIFEGETSQLSVTNDPAYSYEWSPENTIDNPTITNPIANPVITTDYTVTVTDENDCQNTAGVTVTIREGFCDFPYIFVPSGFTPNGDGENDQLFVRGDFIDELTFIVYDRWGDKVFETTNQSIGWDGNKNGQALTAGVYGYYLTTTCKNGDSYQKQGNVTLIR